MLRDSGLLGCYHWAQAEKLFAQFYPGAAATDVSLGVHLWLCVCVVGVGARLLCAPPACLLPHRLSRGCCPRLSARPGSVCTNHLSGPLLHAECCAASQHWQPLACARAAGLQQCGEEPPESVRVCRDCSSAVVRLSCQISCHRCHIAACLSAGLHQHRLPRRSGLCLVLFAVWAACGGALSGCAVCWW